MVVLRLKFRMSGRQGLIERRMALEGLSPDDVDFVLTVSNNY